MVVGGHQSPGGSSEWLRLITYNNQILEGAAGGGNGLAFVEHCRRGRWSRLTNVSHRRAGDEGTAIHRRERHPPSTEDEISGRARLGWL